MQKKPCEMDTLSACLVEMAGFAVFDCCSAAQDGVQYALSSVAADKQHTRPLWPWFSTPAKGHAATWKAKNQRGFLFSTVRARIDKAHGPAWAAPKEHRGRTLRMADFQRGCNSLNRWGLV